MNIIILIAVRIYTLFSTEYIFKHTLIWQTLDWSARALCGRDVVGCVFTYLGICGVSRDVLLRCLDLIGNVNSDTVNYLTYTYRKCTRLMHIIQAQSAGTL